MLSQQSFWATSARRPKCLHRWLLFLVLLCAGEQITLIWRIPASKSESNQNPIIKVNWIKLIQHDTTIPHVDYIILFILAWGLFGGRCVELGDQQLNHADLIHVEGVKFPELCWNLNGQLQQLGTKTPKFHRVTGEVGKFDFPLSFAGKIPTRVRVQHL